MRIHPSIAALLVGLQTLPAMAAEVVELPSLVIRGTRPKLADAPQGVVRLGREAIRARGARDLAQLLGGEPSFSVRRLGAAGQLSTATVRGSLGEGVLVLKDGVKLNSPVLGGLDLSTVSLVGVEEVQILKGAASGLYGAEAVGGVILLKTAKTPQHRMEGGLGSFGERYVQLETGLSQENAAFTLGVRRTTATNDYPYFYRDTETTRANSGLEGLDVSFGSQHTWGYDTLRFALSLVNQDKGIPGPVNYPSVEARQHDRDVSGSLAWSQWHPEGPHQTTSLSHRRSAMTFADPRASAQPPSDTLLDATDAQTVAEWELGAHLVTLGGGVSFDGLASSNLGPRSRAILTTFAHETWYATEALSLFGDLRLDHHSTFGLNVSPRLGANYRLSDRHRLWASVGQAYRAPTFNDLYWPSSSMSAGNPALQPEHTDGAELGAEATLAEWFLVESAMFVNQGTNTLMWLPDARGVWSPRNIGRTESRGIDVKATLHAGEALTLEGGGTWLSALDRAESGATAGKALLYRPDWVLRAALTYRPLVPLSLGLAWDYTGKRYITAQNTESLPPHDLWSAQVGYDVTGQDRLLVKLENLTNTYYQLQPYYPMPGRAFLASWAHTF